MTEFEDLSILLSLSANLLQRMILRYFFPTAKFRGIPLVQQLNQPAFLVDYEVYNTAKSKLLAGGFPARKVDQKGAAVDGADAESASSTGECLVAVHTLDLHVEIGNRRSPNGEVASQDSGAGAAELEGVVDVGCCGGVEGEPGGRVRAGPAGGPAGCN
jgi:hypothetical protein